MTHNILHLDTERSWRGGERQLFLLLKHMESSDFVHYAACRDNTVLSGKMKELGVKILPLAPYGEIDLFSVFKLRRFIKSKNIDLVHAHTSHTVGLGALALVKLKKVFVAHRRVDFPVKKNFFSKFKYSKADRIITVSKAIRSVLLSDGFDEKRIKVVYSGIDISMYNSVKNIDLRKEYSIPENTIIIGMVTALAPHKDIFNFLEAVKAVVNMGLSIRGFVVGEGVLKDELEARRDALGLGERVNFVGFKTNHLEWLSSFDIFVISSYLEGLGSIVLDAMALGKSIVATEAGGIPEMIKNERNGLLVPIKNPDKMAEAIKRLIQDAKLRENISTNAKVDVDSFNIKNTVRDIHGIYKELLNG
ncbi:MAG: glycosyltransferase [bacterium]